MIEDEIELDEGLLDVEDADLEVGEADDGQLYEHFRIEVDKGQ